jgi:hypothetical protein
MKRNGELLQQLVDGIAEFGSIKNACRACFVSKAAFFNWAKQSATNGGEEYMVSVGDESMLFHEAIKMAQRQVSFDILENFRLKLLRGGSYEPAKFQGKTVYKRDPALDHLSDQDLQDLGIVTRYLRGPDGEFLPEQVFTEISTQALLAFLASEFKQWGNKQTIEVRSQSTGVQIVKPQYAPRPSLALVQEVAAIEAPIVDVEPEDVESDDLSDILGEEPVTEPELVAETPPIAPPPIVQPARPAEPAKPLTELQLDLLERLKRRPGADRASPVTAQPVFRPELDDSDPRRTGAGSPPPGAIRVV